MFLKKNPFIFFLLTSVLYAQKPCVVVQLKNMPSHLIGMDQVSQDSLFVNQIRNFMMKSKRVALVLNEQENFENRCVTFKVIQDQWDQIGVPTPEQQKELDKQSFGEKVVTKVVSNALHLSGPDYSNNIKSTLRIHLEWEDKAKKPKSKGFFLEHTGGDLASSQNKILEKLDVALADFIQDEFSLKHSILKIEANRILVKGGKEEGVEVGHIYKVKSNPNDSLQLNQLKAFAIVDEVEEHSHTQTIIRSFEEISEQDLTLEWNTSNPGSLQISQSPIVGNALSRSFALEVFTFPFKTQYWGVGLGYLEVPHFRENQSIHGFQMYGLYYRKLLNWSNLWVSAGGKLGFGIAFAKDDIQNSIYTALALVEPQVKVDYWFSQNESVNIQVGYHVFGQRLQWQHKVNDSTSVKPVWNQNMEPSKPDISGLRIDLGYQIIFGL
jgi:hypothetical protein